MNKRPQIVLEYAEHRRQLVVVVKVNYYPIIIKLIKNNTTAKWSATMGCWYFYKEEFKLHVFFELMKNVAFIDYSAVKKKVENPKRVQAEQKTVNYNIKELKQQLTPETKEKLNRFKSWMQQMRYGDNTIKTYIHQLEIFFGYYYKNDIEVIDNNDIIQFNQRFIMANKLSATFQNQTISALKKFYKFQLNQFLNIEDIERPIKARPLPKVMSKNELQKFFGCIKNTKHKMAMETIYAYGLRRGELLNLKLQHIDRARGSISIINAKGKKDRMLPISRHWLKKVIPYYHAERPEVFLIEGQYPQKAISAGSLQKVFGRALDKSEITKPYTIHCLRHSIATHMLEGGTDLRYIQEFLGHRSSKTTEIYTHVSNESLKNIKNPFDDFDI